MAFSALSVGSLEITKLARLGRIDSAIQSHPFSLTDGIGNPRANTAKVGTISSISELNRLKVQDG